RPSGSTSGVASAAILAEIPPNPPEISPEYKEVLTMQLTKALVAAGALASAAALLTACGSGTVGQTGSSSQTNSANSKKLAYVAGVQAEPFYISLQCGAEAEAKKLGYELTTQAPQKFDAPLQTQIVNALGANPPAALLIAPTDDTAMLAPIQQVKSRGTKIIEVD